LLPGRLRVLLIRLILPATIGGIIASLLLLSRSLLIPLIGLIVTGLLVGRRRLILLRTLASIFALLLILRRSLLILL